jgi:lysophospholipase L1-like esterase
VSEGAEPARPLSRTKLVAFAIVVDIALLLLLEGAARLFVPAPEASRFGEFSRLAIELGLSTLQKALVPDRTLFWRLRPGLLPTIVEGRVGPSDPIRFTLSTTPDGFRSPAPGRPPSVVCLGDSCTFGLGVNDAETFPAQLGGSTGEAVLNAGVPGYTAFQGRRLLDAHLEEWRAKAIVIQFGWNDSASWDGRSDAEHAALLSREPGLLFRSRFVQFLASLLPERRGPPAHGSAPSGRPRLTPEEFAGELRGIVRLSRSAGALPVLVVWPARYHLQGIRIPPHTDVIRTVAAAEGAPLVDLFTVFPREGGIALYADAVHTNAAGNRAVAAAVATALHGGLRENIPGSSSASASGRGASPPPSGTRSPPSSSSSGS